MSVKMTDEEKLFVQDILATSKRVEVTDSGSVVPIRKAKKIPPYKNLNNWAIAFMIFPFVVSGFFLAGMFRLSAYMGEESLILLSQNQFGEDFAQLMKFMGFSDFSLLVSVYEVRWFIVAAVFFVSFAIATVFLLLNYKKLLKVRQKRVSGEKQE